MEPSAIGLQHPAPVPHMIPRKINDFQTGKIDHVVPSVKLLQVRQFEDTRFPVLYNSYLVHGYQR
jgi:hypothetical protein